MNPTNAINPKYAKNAKKLNNAQNAKNAKKAKYAKTLMEKKYGLDILLKEIKIDFVQYSIVFDLEKGRY